jgi:SAM-dependent methyltransferase
VTRESAREWTASLALKYLPGEGDGYKVFLRLISDSCRLDSIVADIGCGDEEFLTCLMQRVRQIIGIDNREVQGTYHSYLKTDIEKELFLPECSLDVAASKFLLEHISDPVTFFKSIYAALRPGGKLVIMTPNIRYYPYAINYILSRFLPQKARMRLVHLITGRGEDEIFPIVYACNTPNRLRMMLEQAGFEVLYLDTFSDFRVSAFNRPLGAVAIGYEKLVNSVGIKGVKGFIVVEGRKA